MYRSTKGSALIISVMMMIATALGLSAQEVIKPSGGRIVESVPTSIQQHPWQAALIAERPDGTFLCGGSIIEDQWVLTAAHCFGKAGTRAKAKVKTGVTNYRTEGDWVIVVRIEPHAQYNAKTRENDIALVKLGAKSHGEPIALAGNSTQIPVGKSLEITGWGATAEGRRAVDSLRKAEVNYVTTSTCNAKDSYDGTIKDGMMCAGFAEGRVDTCQGDSGGPLVMKSDISILVGVVSFGEGCARPHKYGVYTRVSAYRAWVATVLASDKGK